jgi:hypothetical protein
MSAKERTNKPAATRKYVSPKERPYRQSVIILIIGDIMCFLIFSIIGVRTHGEPTGLASIPHIIIITIPFVVAWFLVSPLVGAFRRDLIAQPRLMATRTAIAWLISWPVALLLRGILIDHGIPGYMFSLIALVFNLVVLEVWRWPFALNNSMRQRGM